MSGSLSALLRDVRACRLCAHELEPNPVLRLSRQSRILLVGQAPGSKVHASGEPWRDASGDHLLQWLGVSRTTFENPDAFAILPMAFCYPGKGKSGDKPPPPRCARTWHAPLRAQMSPRLTLAVGQYAIAGVLGSRRRKTLTETVRCFEHYAPDVLVLPHPSWRSKVWMRRNPWFEERVLPVLKTRVQEALSDL